MQLITPILFLSIISCLNMIARLPPTTFTQQLVVSNRSQFLAELLSRHTIQSGTVSYGKALLAPRWIRMARAMAFKETEIAPEANTGENDTKAITLIRLI